MIIILNKYQTNKILNSITETPYNLILKLIYVYGQNSKTINYLKVEDINLEKNTILLKDKPYPLTENLKKELLILIEDKKPTDYIFQEYCDLRTITNKLNTILFKADTFHQNVTTETLRILRGQHLLQEGVSLKNIQELFNHKRTYQTINLLCSKDNLSLNEIMNDYTDLKLYYDNEYTVNNDYYVTYHNREAIITCDDNIQIEGDLLIQMEIKNISQLPVILDSLKNIGEYKVIGDFKIMKL